MTDTADFDFIEKKLAPIVCKISKDKVSNVRMNCATVLKKISAMSKSKEVLAEIQPCIEELKRDLDIDVTNALNDN